MLQFRLYFQKLLTGCAHRPLLRPGPLPIINVCAPPPSQVEPLLSVMNSLEKGHRRVIYESFIILLQLCSQYYFKVIIQ